jgi:hypothetical protein
MSLPRRLAALALALTTACSLATVRRAPRGPLTGPPDCTHGVAAPVVDAAVVGGAVVTGALIIALSYLVVIADGPPRDRSLLVPITGAATGLTALGFGASASIGMERVGGCREAEEIWRRHPTATEPPLAPDGDERGRCRDAPAPPCAEGLTCASRRCVRL